ncbi:MAG TPA: nicotinate phosphoribosyltransferase [Gammaproteobacteria bacterium]|nr:nicotinate phosphoribosyltransferase [Gammaproteobacteria bacterium]
MVTISSLFTDFYQLTMAYGYWQLNRHEEEAVFHLSFRKNPFQGRYTLCCGLETAIDFLNNWRFQKDDLAYLGGLKNTQNTPLFSENFLSYLENMTFSCDIDAIPEGSVVFPHTPILRIQGPLLQCQLLESPLLNFLNFQTLIATKAATICQAAGDDAVIEFGMRRAQGPDGALSASRAAYIGGCIATSNTLAGKYYDIPVRGTHAHSWVSAFPDELTAFQTYADIMPHNCVLLVDTYDTIQGVKNAITVGKKLREKGADLLGIRLDSGDMKQLSVEARKLLDEAGFSETDILASNLLNEDIIANLKQNGAKVSVWGVGTSLVTAYNQPALDGVYKLGALKDEKGNWQYKLKLSERTEKTSTPGRHQVRRFFCNDQYVIDVVYDLDIGISDTPEIVLQDETLAAPRLDDYDAFVDLLQPIFRKGKRVAETISIHDIREKAILGVAHFNQTHQQSYPVALEKKLYILKDDLKLHYTASKTEKV